MMNPVKIDYDDDLFETIEIQINERATILAKQYKTSNPEHEFDKVYLVYKILETPTTLLLQGLKELVER